MMNASHAINTIRKVLVEYVETYQMDVTRPVPGTEPFEKKLARHVGDALTIRNTPLDRLNGWEDILAARLYHWLTHREETQKATAADPKARDEYAFMGWELVKLLADRGVPFEGLPQQGA